MTAYFVTTLIVVIFTALAQRVRCRVILVGANGRRYQMALCGLLFWLAAVVLIFVGGTRYYVGTDYGAYYHYNDRYAAELWSRVKAFDEPIYPFLTRIAQLLDGGATLSLFLASAVTHGINLRTVYKNTDQLIYAAMLYLFLGCWHAGFNAVRQCLAGALVFAGYGFLRDKRFWPYLLCVLLAFLCHRSAILMIVPFFLVNRKVNIPNFLLLAVGTVVITAAESFVFSATESILDESLGGTGQYLVTQVNVLRVLVGVVPAVFFAAVLRGKVKAEGNAFYFNLLLFHAAISVATAGSAYYARYTIYTSPFLAIAIPGLSKALPERSRKQISFLILALYCLFWIYEISHSSALNHFQFIWQR